MKKSSLNSKAVGYEEHEKWFRKKKNSKGTQMYKLCLDDLPIGQIRFDRYKKNFSQIDYSIHKDYRGYGYGNKLIRLGIKKNHKSKIKKYKAITKNTNIPSIKIFKANNVIIIKKIKLILFNIARKEKKPIKIR